MTQQDLARPFKSPLADTPSCRPSHISSQSAPPLSSEGPSPSILHIHRDSHRSQRRRPLLPPIPGRRPLLPPPTPKSDDHSLRARRRSDSHDDVQSHEPCPQPLCPPRICAGDAPVHARALDRVQQEGAATRPRAGTALELGLLQLCQLGALESAAGRRCLGRLRGPLPAEPLIDIDRTFEQDKSNSGLETVLRHPLCTRPCAIHIRAVGGGGKGGFPTPQKQNRDRRRNGHAGILHAHAILVFWIHRTGPDYSYLLRGRVGVSDTGIQDMAQTFSFPRRGCLLTLYVEFAMMYLSPWHTHLPALMWLDSARGVDLPPAARYLYGL